MGVFDWVMNGIGFESDSESDENQKLEKKPKKKKHSWFGRRSKDDENVLEEETPERSFDMDQFNALKENSDNEDTGDSSQYGGYSNSYSGFSGTTSYSNKNFVFFNPTNYEEIKRLVEYLKQGEPAIVNLDKISETEAQRSLDFISGAACALGGKLQRITGNYFLVTPDGYNITKPSTQE